jgi:hypothetical protein
MNVERRARICVLNDRLRQHHKGGRIHLSRGLVHLGAGTVQAALRAIAEIQDFRPENDPYGEHDFGSVVVAGERLFWKIDYYDHSLTSQAVDPADESACVRILTVMLAYEY